MPNVLIGLDYDGIAAVKVTKDAYNPVTTPDSNVGAFLYNSKTAADMKVTAVLDPAVIFASATTGANYLPSGSTAASALAACYKRTDDMPCAVQVAYTDESYYDLPLFDLKKFDSSSARFVQAKLERGTFGAQNRGIVYQLRNNGAWYKGYTSNATTWWTGTKANSLSLSWNYSAAYGYERDIAVVWRLPGDNTAIVDGAAKTPVAGQYTVQITGEYCRVAKPGYDVRTATKTQLAFDSSSNPSKVIAAGDIAVPVGASEYDVGFTLPDGVLADIHFYSGSTIYYPINPVSGSTAPIIGADYWLSGSKLKFQNAGVVCRARFIIYAYDDTPATSGDYSVIRQTTIGGVGVVQLVRPGAGVNPSFADIVMDTRWPALRMIDEGYIAVSAGENTYEVNFSSAGMLPMVKFCTVHGAKSGGGTTWSRMIRTPRVSVVYIDPQVGSVEGWVGGDTCYCTLTSSKATFRTFRGNPTRVYYNTISDAENDTRTIVYDDSPIVGIRYYIFGIPQ